MRGASILVLAMLAFAGCAPSDRDVRIERARAETRMLAQNLDRLEDRLLANQARVRLWRELKDRHESVSAIACASQEEHAAEMAMHTLPPAPAARLAARTPPARIAAAASGPAKPLIRGSAHR